MSNAVRGVACDVNCVDCAWWADRAETAPLPVNPRLFMEPSIFTMALLGQHSFVII